MHAGIVGGSVAFPETTHAFSGERTILAIGRVALWVFGAFARRIDSTPCDFERAIATETIAFGNASSDSARTNRFVYHGGSTYGTECVLALMKDATIVNWDSTEMASGNEGASSRDWRYATHGLP